MGAATPPAAGAAAGGERSQIDPLTSLRFFAALWVVAHAYWPDLATSSTPALIQRGYLGVELFFVLSGFILCHVYLSAFTDGGFSYFGFLWSRLARVYPLHLVTLAGIGAMAAAALAAGLQVDRNILAWSALPANLTLTQAWGLAGVAGWNHPSWSISAEWFAYLAFPLFASATLRLQARPRAALCAALTLLAGLYLGFPCVAHFPLTEATIAWGALRITPCFALGCATYLLWRSGATDRRNTAREGVLLFAAGVLLGSSFGAPDLVIVAGFSGLVLGLANLSRDRSRLLSHPLLVYLGEISYSIYMISIPWQLLFVNAAVRVLQLHDKKLPWYIWVIFLTSLIPLAAMSHELVEKPARQGMKLWARRGRLHEIASAGAG